MTEPSKRPIKSLSTSSSISDLSYEDVRLEEANRVSSNRTGTERSASVGLPQAALAPAEISPFAAAGGAEEPVETQSEDVEISWRGGAFAVFGGYDLTYILGQCPTAKYAMQPRHPLAQPFLWTLLPCATTWLP